MMQHKRTSTFQQPVRRGYIEGFYGRLLGFDDRLRLLDQLAKTGANSYFYAPKEDICHRLAWREKYDDSWIDSFSAFCAQSGNIDILAGIAPGLDYDLHSAEAEYAALRAKAEQLLAAGADALVLMFDDISDDVSAFERAGLNEGAVHGGLVRRLHDDLGCRVDLVPRLYADEIGGDIEGYADGLAETLPEQSEIYICGMHIVAKQVNLQNDAGRLATYLAQHASPQNLVIWDNLYCHDYCPRRLFLCTYDGRAHEDPLLLNGTGLVETDRLYIALMQGADRQALFSSAGVPDCFWQIAEFFDRPVFTDGAMPAAIDLSDRTTTLIKAVDEMLWRWKSPLAREWYPFLFGLKHDLQIASKLMAEDRLAKTQTPILYDLLKGQIL
ncbi:MAG: beta-N-acetylglucosaminidase domain-containing protein [Candidatus Puniceispirillaceae bacterium]